MKNRSLLGKPGGVANTVGGGGNYCVTQSGVFGADDEDPNPKLGPEQTLLTRWWSQSSLPVGLYASDKSFKSRGVPTTNHLTPKNICLHTLKTRTARSHSAPEPVF